jgi:hypothetical protein
MIAVAFLPFGLYAIARLCDRAARWHRDTDPWSPQ